jgi:hypothetical protein
MIRSEHMKSCLTAQIGFMLFKGPGSFNKKLKICGNVEEYKADRLIPLTTHLFFHFTLPLSTILLACQLETYKQQPTFGVVVFLSLVSFTFAEVVGQMYSQYIQEIKNLVL